MKILIMLLALMSYSKAGDAPVCAFDGYLMQCYYYDWEQCESQRSAEQRCVANPDR